ncbi:hypothetical protein BG844_20130 [Couchioplanes caeruleus subsp. caeruleus]|uniref:CAAX prenyl protease 2/Lysostaphin resistance protein A-like domain-containing protein n=2 Tax=Couchioplanes caeruleus TaxID=56438 RepID=A0A1K0G5G8_9ACTN|nr:hypothetical protein BG844_20130 [Couchioplanes caeruleus subsp. caeruleus]
MTATAVISTAVLRGGSVALVLLLMWTPGLASVVLRLAGRQGFADVSFRFYLRRSWPWYLTVWLMPVAVGGLAYSAAWMTGMVDMAAGVGGAAVARTVLGALTVGVPLAALTALGEELGWRGFLVPRLAQAGAPRPALMTAVAWWLFHVPLILGGVYASGSRPWLHALIFGIVILSLSGLAGWSRLATGSVWPAVLLHSSWNAVIQSAFDASTAGAGPRAAGNLWVGESGLFVAAAALLVTGIAALILRRSTPAGPSS